MSDRQPSDRQPSDKQPMQATSKGGANKPDGVDEAPAKGAGGESGGGAYPNPHAGKTPEGGGFMGHGGQTENAYSGPGDKDDPGKNANAVAE